MLHIDFSNKRTLTSSVVYKQNEIDNKGVSAKLINVDLDENSSGAAFWTSPSGETMQTEFVINGEIGTFKVPTSEIGTWILELVVYNDGRPKSADYNFEILKSYSVDPSNAEIELLIETIVRHDHTYTTNENIRIENENTRIIEHDDRMNKSNVATNEAIQATQRANTATTDANEATQRANDSAENAEHAIENMVQLTGATVTATANANAQAEHAKMQGDYAKTQGDHAKQATIDASNATSLTNQTIQQANTATTNAVNATNNAVTATERANTATQQANTATANAETATQATIQATTEARSATTNAIQATNNAQTATTNANTATANANNATVNANTATTNANTATTKANQAVTSVQNAIAAGTVDLEPKQARTDTSGFEHANLKARLDSDYKRLSEDFYGVEFLGSNATGKRLGRAHGLIANVGVDATVNANDFDNQFPWSDIVTVNLGHDGVIKAYEGQPSFKRDGSNGEVMVRIPKFYQKRIENDAEYKAFFISKHRLDGYYLNPLFVSDSTGEELDYAYIGAYKASSDGTKLFSRSGVYPQVSLSRTAFRTRAKATGLGFQIRDFLERDLINSLLYIEFANLNLQTKMMGQVNFSAQKASIATENTNYAIVSNTSANQYVEGQTILVAGQQRKLLSKTSHDASNMRLNFDGTALSVTFDSTIDMRAWQCGACDNVKQRSGSFVSNTDGKHPFVYRGIENLWGDTWEWVDGININEYQSYISTNPSSYADGVYSGAYSAVNGLNLATTSQYIKKMRFDERFPFFSLPELGGGSSTTHYSDYYRCNPGERAPLVGGNWDVGVACGPAFWNCNLSAANSDATVGARLSYKPL